MDVLSAMLEPSTYPHPVSPVRHIETHISHIYLTGEFAYKLKKPLQNPFLDYRTLAARKKYCERELALNRRFAPDLYLDVVAVAREGTGWNLDGRGEIVEYAVKMREFPQAALLLTQLKSGHLGSEQVRSLGAELARIHQSAPRLADLGLPFGSPAAVARDSRDNITALRELLPSAKLALVDSLGAQIEQQSANLASALGRRREEGFVRECHGDLHLGNLIWYAGRVQLFDGIEFNESFRWIDVMSDLGFVLMDLEEHGERGLANLLLNVYLEGCGDFDGLRVLGYFKVYRAMVRAKVAALRAAQQPEAERVAAWGEVDNYLACAAAELNARKPRLVLTHGVSGSGKTYQTEPLLEVPGVIRIRSDVERKRMEGLQPGARAASRPGEGLYTASRKGVVYERLAELAEIGLAAGWNVILDATFLEEKNRQDLLGVARRLGVRAQILHFEATESVLRARLEERGRRGGDASDAGWEVLQAQLRACQPLSPDEVGLCTTVSRLTKELSIPAHDVEQA